MTEQRDNQTQIEHRVTAACEVKLAGGDAMTFEGYATVWSGVDAYGDSIAKGAYRDTLAEHRKSGRWPVMLANHGGFLGSDPTPVGVWTEMREDDRGLWVEGRFAPTARGEELHTLVKMGALSGLSIGFRPVEWKMRAKPEEPRRTLTKIDLVEVSVVALPADPKARITAVKAIESPNDLEALLIAGGLPRAAARAVVKHGAKGLDLKHEPELETLAQRLDLASAELRAFTKG